MRQLAGPTAAVET